MTKNSAADNDNNALKDHPAAFYTNKGDYVCPVATIFDLLKGRWKINILWALHKNPVMRFHEIRESVAGISEKVLTDQLRELEKIGFVERRTYAEFPPRVEYRLTNFARTFTPILANVADWGLENREKILEILQR